MTSCFVRGRCYQLQVANLNMIDAADRPQAANHSFEECGDVSGDEGNARNEVHVVVDQIRSAPYKLKIRNNKTATSQLPRIL